MFALTPSRQRESLLLAMLSLLPLIAKPPLGLGFCCSLSSVLIIKASLGGEATCAAVALARPAVFNGILARGVLSRMYLRHGFDLPDLSFDFDMFFLGNYCTIVQVFQGALQRPI